MGKWWTFSHHYSYGVLLSIIRRTGMTKYLEYTSNGTQSKDATCSVRDKSYRTNAPSFLF